MVATKGEQSREETEEDERGQRNCLRCGVKGGLAPRAGAETRFWRGKEAQLIFLEEFRGLWKPGRELERLQNLGNYSPPTSPSV